MNPTIVICGAGGIGRAAALILACNPAMNPKIFIGDINSNSLGEAVNWITEGKNREIPIKSFIMSLEQSNEEMDHLFEKADVILDCLPGSQAPRIAKLAKKFDAHYANLTEYVKETNEILELTKDAKKGFLLQTGIAPGYVNVLACKLYNQFKEKFGVEQLESMKMRVGALSESASAPSYYAFTWSTIGVATEYMKDAEIIRNGKKQRIPSLSGKARLIVNGETFEENYTSGGAANLPNALEGFVKDLDYKTIRYVGHFDWVGQGIEKFSDPSELDQYMRSVVPNVENDRIVMYASVTGKDKSGELRCIDQAYDISPTMIGKKTLRAIQSTTASALCEAAYYMLKNDSEGVILQTDIKPMEFLNGPYVTTVFGSVKR